MIARCASILAAVLASLPASAAAGATEPAREKSETASIPDVEYLVRSWQTEDGLPQNSVPALAQTPDGFLWIGTFNGLVRFDGTTFRTYFSAATRGLRSDSINDLRVDRAGRLWIATDTGGISVFDGAGFEAFVPQGPPGRECALGLATAPDGAVWVFTRAGLYRFANRRFSGPVSPPRDFPEVLDMACDEQGRLWIGTRDGLFESDGARFDKVEGPVGTCRLTRTRSRTGGVLAVSPHSGLWSWDQQAWTRVPGLEGWPCTRALEERDGDLWLELEGTRGFLRREGTNLVRVVEHRDLAKANRHVLFLDDEDALWVGVNGSGLHRLRRKVLQGIGSDEGLPSEDVVCLLEDRQGHVWVGAYGGGVYRVDQGRAGEVSGMPGAGQIVYALALDTDGSVLAGHASGVLFRWQESGSVDTRSLSLEGARVIHRAPDGALWLGSRHGGVVRELAGESTRYSLTNGLAHDFVTSIVSRPGGETWVGTKGGLHRVVDGRIERFGREHGLGAEAIQTLYGDAQGVLWVGTAGGGLSRWRDGRFDSLDSTRGLANDVVAQLIEDDLGGFWIGSNAGLLRVERRQLEACLDGEVSSIQGMRFGRSDGMRNVECAGSFQSSCLKARDGRLWFATVGGIVVVDPKELPPLGRPPRVRLAGMKVNGIPTEFPRFNGPASRVRSVGPGVDRLEIDYTALDFLATGPLKFRFRLEGVDAAWVEADRMRTAVYTGLDPGRYRFAVTASGVEGGWNPAVETLDIEVRAFWWETMPFRLGVAGVMSVAGIGIGWGWHRRRLRRKVESELRRQERAHAEALGSANRALGVANHALTARTQELEEALANVKELRGLIPICAGCKRIRDDRGYWNQVETYIQQRSHAFFSHGICPDCLKKSFGEYADRVMGDGSGEGQDPGPCDSDRTGGSVSSP